uniref:Reelin n=1 Tax=Periophthalmus magnuspinnatus TaxID=409849 RepID=A0A3B3ZR49_9GOBI
WYGYSREEGVLLQYSNDGGITWGLIAEMYFTDFTKPRFVHYELPLASKTPSTRFRWWQPLHSGEGYDQWAIDDVIILSERENFHIFVIVVLCLNENNLSFVHHRTFMKNQIYQSFFPLPQLNIGCESEFSASAPVLLQYSHDAGRTWALVREGCYPGTPGVGVLFTCNIHLYSKTRFRWFQESSLYRDAPPFALDGVYISEPCPNHCGGHGDCISGVCFCDMGYTGTANTHKCKLTEGFEGKLSPLWQSLIGGQIGGGCGIIGEGKALYFNSPGRREARTVPLDTTNTRLILVQFYIRIGSKSLGPTCTRPRSRNEGVIVQFSTNNGIQWQFLRELDFSSFLEPQVVTIELPSAAKAPYTVFRWWQPQQVVSLCFQDKFDGSSPLRHNWYRIQGGEVTIDCLSLDTVLTFNSEAIDSELIKYFELSMGCSKSTSFSHGVRLEYSTDCGRHWTLLTPECVPPAIGCAAYTQSSVYTSTQHKHWRRITVYLPSHYKIYFSSPRTRFRWIQTHFTPGAEGWALDNVLLAPGCPWMCSGHVQLLFTYLFISVLFFVTITKYCLNTTAVTRVTEGRWSAHAGHKRLGLVQCSVKHFNSLNLLKGVLTPNTTALCRFVQFFLRLGCGKAAPDPRSQPVLLQFSVDGGLTWGLLQEFLFSNSSNQARLVALEIPLRARTSSTRLRWWQPSESGHFYSPWVIDQVKTGANASLYTCVRVRARACIYTHTHICGNNIVLFQLVVGGSASGWGPLEDDFSSIDGRSWLLHPGGTRMPVCGSEGPAFAFIEKSNTRYAVTTDISLGQDAFIQFDFSASCSVTSSCYCK